MRAVEHEQTVRVITSSAAHWIFIGACVGILVGMAIVAFALHVGGVL